MYDLSRFGRPVNDSSCGIHLWPNGYGMEPEKWLDRVVEMRMKWVTTLNTDPGFMRACAQRGLGVVCRPFYRANREWGDDGSAVENMLAAGLPPYIQIYNEPELLGTEWENEVPGSEDWARETWANRWLSAASYIASRGGYPGIQVLDLNWYRYILQRIKAENPGLIDKLWFCCHNYMSNHPIEYMQDEFGWLAPLWFDKVANEVLGHSLVTICGEGGWCIGDAADNRWPAITAETHRDNTVASFNVFRTGILPTGQLLPDWWVAVTPWLLVSVQVGGDASFEQNAWYSDWVSKQLTIDAVKAMPVFVRANNGQTPPQPEPIPTPEPTPVPEPTPAPTPSPAPVGIIIPNAPWNPARVLSLSGAVWRIVKLEMLNPCENHMMEVCFVEVRDEQGQPLDGVKVHFQAGPDFGVDVVSGEKGAGKIEFLTNYPVDLSVWVTSGSSDIAQHMENTHVFDNDNIPESYRICAATGEEGNAPKHLSYRVVLQKAGSVPQPVPEPQPPEEEPPMSLAEQFPEAFTAWVDAGGDPEEAFRFYLLGTGRLPVNNIEVAQAVSRVQAHVGELAAIVSRLPK